MVNRQEKHRMVEYILSRLEGCGEKIRYEPLPKEDLSIILVGGDGAILLIDRVFPNKTFNRLWKAAKNTKKRVATIFYKDDETYFRSKAEEITGKRDGLSLGKYSAEDVRRMVSFRPEEHFLFRQRDSGGLLQYYQPKTTNLVEGIRTFEFEPITYKYDHLVPQDETDPKPSFNLEDRESTKIFKWKDTPRYYTGQNLVLSEKGFLIPQKEQLRVEQRLLL